MIRISKGPLHVQTQCLGEGMDAELLQGPCRRDRSWSDLLEMQGNKSSPLNRKSIPKRYLDCKRTRSAEVNK